MALLPYKSLGNGLYKDSSGRYFQIRKGQYKDSTGKTKTGKVRYYVNPNALSLTPYEQVGNNLYKDAKGSYFYIEKGLYKDAAGNEKFGGVRRYVENPYKPMDFKTAEEQARKQLDPIYQKALQNIQAQKYQNELNASQEAAARGLSHSGLAADLQNKIALATQSQIADMEAEKSSKIAQLAQQLVDADAERKARQEAMDYQRYLDSVRNNQWQQEFDYQRSRDAVRDKQWQQQFDYQRSRDAVQDKQWQQQFEYQKYLDKLKDQRAQEALAWEKQQFATEQAWRQYVYNHMSAAERAQLEWNKQQFGEEMAWRIEEANRADKLARDRMEFEAGKKGLNGEGSDGKYDNFWKTRKDAAKAPGFVQFNSILMKAIDKAGVPDSWAPYIMELVGRESSWNPNAKNPKSTAYGYGQFLKSTRQEYERKYGIKYDTPLNQLILTIHYIKDRYGNPVNALRFWDEHNWY